MSISSRKSGTSQSSINSTYSRASGIRALDDLRTAKAETVDTRQIVYKAKVNEEKQMVKDMIAVQL